MCWTMCSVLDQSLIEQCDGRCVQYWISLLLSNVMEDVFSIGSIEQCVQYWISLLLSNVMEDVFSIGLVSC